MNSHIKQEDWTSVKSDIKAAKKALETLKESVKKHWEDPGAAGGQPGGTTNPT
jgi:hypothetical protein